MAETDHLGVHLEHINKLETGLVQQNSVVRDCPSLVGGRPAKSVVERPRGFKSHIPRHFELWHSVSQFMLHICCEESVYCGFLKKKKKWGFLGNNVYCPEVTGEILVKQISVWNSKVPFHTPAITP